MRVARLGMGLSVILHSLYPRRYKFIQSLMGVELWRQSSTQKTFNIMSVLGLSQCHRSTLQHVDSFCLEHDEKLKMWKENIQVNIN